MTLFDHRSLLLAVHNLNQEQLAGQLDRLVRVLGEHSFCAQAAGHLVALARPEAAIPASLARFTPLIRDGIESFLARISSARLRRVILGQAALPQGCDPGERLQNLALHFPSLHKLGQIVARNRDLAPQVKRWLIGLEQGDYGTDPVAQVDHIREQLARVAPLPELTLSGQILAEASVATVLPFRWRNPDSGRWQRGVFKVLKPGIAAELREELEILAQVFSFLERHRSRYGLQQMRLAGLLAEIRGDLAREVDLSAEQQNLAEAAKMYGSIAGVRIPQLVPLCTPAMTAMAYIDGSRITDLRLPKNRRLALACQVFYAILCVPLFAREEVSLFHGDPHAGNILAVPGRDPDSFDIALLDWTLAGHLSKKQRTHFFALLLGIVTNDGRALGRAVRCLAAGAERQEMTGSGLFAEMIEDLLAAQDYRACDPLHKAFRLLEQMTLAGLIFPAELILYRKAFFTLEGVLHDISPDFSMGEAMERYLAGLLVGELPWRFSTWLVPLADRPENYRTLMSNQAVQEIALYQATAVWRQTLERSSSIIEAQVKLSTDLFLLLTGCRY